MPDALEDAVAGLETSQRTAEKQAAGFIEDAERYEARAAESRRKAEEATASALKIGRAVAHLKAAIEKGEISQK